MSRIFVTSARVRAILADAKTECDVIDALRRHGIRYRYSTETGYLHIRIPCRTGVVLVFRSVHPLRIPGAVWTGSPFPVPVLHLDN